MSQVPSKYQMGIKKHSHKARKVNMALHGSVVCHRDPFMNKEGIAQSTAIYVPTEVDYCAKDGLQIGSEVFPYAYTNAHTIGYEVVIMVIVQTGSKLTLNTYANAHSHHNEEVVMVITQTGYELLFNAYLNAYSSYYKEAGPELFFNAYLNIHSSHYEKMIG